MIGFKKKKMPPHEDIGELCPGVKKEDILLSFRYNLHPSEPGLRCKGAVVADRHDLIIFRDKEEIERIPLDEISEIKVEVGVGSATVQYNGKNSGVAHLICRMDMSQSKEAIRVSKKFNRIIEGVGFEKYDPESDKGKKDYGFGKKKFSKRDNLRNLKRLWGIVSPYKLPILISMLFFFVVSGLNLISPEISRIITDDYINTGDPESLSATSYVLTILLMLLVQVVLRLFSMFRSHLLINASNGIVVDLRNMLFEKIQKLSIAKISKRTAGELMRRVSHDVGQIRNFLVHFLPALLEQGLLLLAIGIVFVVSDLGVLFILVLIPVPLVVLGFTFFWRKAHKLFRRCWQLGSKTNSILHDIFSGIRVVKSFGMEHKETERYERSAAEERDMQITGRGSGACRPFPPAPRRWGPRRSWQRPPARP